MSGVWIRTALVILISLFILLSACNSLLLMQALDVKEGYVDSQVATLRYIMWTPRRGEVRGVVVLLHGYGGSSEMMSWIGFGLAQQGYVAVAYDAEGHGKSSSSAVYNFSVLLADLGRVLETVNYPGGEVILVGHSMGGEAVQEVGSRVNASKIVVISFPPLNMTGVQRKLLVLAGFDEIFSLESIPLGRLHGWDVYVSPSDDHLSILYNPSVIEKIVSWVAGRDVYTEARLRLSLTLASSVLAVVLMVLVPWFFLRERRTTTEGEMSNAWKMLVTSAAAAPLSFPLLILLSEATRALVASYVLGIFYSLALGVLFINRKNFVQVRSLLLGMKPNLLLIGTALTIYSYTMVYSALQPFLNVMPSVYRAGLVVLLYLLFLPPVAVLEAFSFKNGSNFAVFLGRLAPKLVCFAVAWLVLKVLVGGDYAGYFFVVSYVGILLLAPLDMLASVTASKRLEAVNVIWLPAVLSLVLGSVTPVT
ncbi:MAG: alpha/beta hydrolase [Thermofilum sp.]|nr:alpha/beta hydrolase [Thermofilum sp.]